MSGAKERAIKDRMKYAGISGMCGHHVGVRQKAHILAEGKKTENHVLMLCSTCHIVFDTHVKPKVFKAMGGWTPGLS